MLDIVIAFFTLKVTLISLSVVLGIGLLFLAYKALGTRIGKSILPIQGKNKAFIKTFSKNKKLITTPLCKSKILVTLPQKPSGHHILCFLGNNTSVPEKCAEDAFQNIADATSATVVGFDYPNVGIGGRGAIRSEKVLVNEGIAQVQRLLDEGIEASKITLYGHSLGGAVATLVAAHFHNKKPPQAVSVINDRSFTTAADQAISILNLKNSIAKGVFKILFNISWKMDALSAYNKIPENNKMVIAGANDEHMNYETVALVGRVSSSKNCFIVDGMHVTPLSDLSIQNSGKKVMDCINEFILQQSVSSIVPPVIVPDKKKKNIKPTKKKSQAPKNERRPVSSKSQRKTPKK